MRRSNTKTELYLQKGKTDSYEKLKLVAASKLQPYTEHRAGKGSCYIFVGALKIRIANHENTSSQYEEPDINIINRPLSDEDVDNIAKRIDYASDCKQRAFSLHVNQTIPALKKILPHDCFGKTLENELYVNTYTTVIKVGKALKFLDKQGMNERRPVRQETYMIEDYDGY